MWLNIKHMNYPDFESTAFFLNNEEFILKYPTFYINDKIKEYEDNENIAFSVSEYRK